MFVFSFDCFWNPKKLFFKQIFWLLIGINSIGIHKLLRSGWTFVEVARIVGILIFRIIVHQQVGKTKSEIQYSSVQSLSHVQLFGPHESQHARPPCPSPTPRVHSDSRPSSWWCHPAISSSAVPFSFCPQSLPASESFPMSQLFTWGGQSTGVSALAGEYKF